ncbi:MAG TPA: NYN domain-containing protein [Gaiellaceae bacterium]|nr:NYN domain-containing protein [Gaiellaceae bacterium]
MSAEERTRVAVFIDWQNTWHAAREAFGWTAFPNEYGNYSPLRLAEFVAEGNGRGALGQVVRVNIHRGLPSNKRDPQGYGAVRRQAQAWIAENPDVVVPKLRPLRYYGPEAEPREKGIDVEMAIEAVRFVLEGRCDVAVLFSHDTDLVPAIDAIAALVETVSWVAPGFPRRLRVRRRIYHHELDENHFAWVEDRVNYAYRG